MPGKPCTSTAAGCPSLKLKGAVFRALKHVEIGDAKFLQRHAAGVDQIEEEEKAALDDDPPAGATQKKILPARREGQEDASADIQDVQSGVDPQEPLKLARLTLDADGIVDSRPLSSRIAQTKGRDRRVDGAPEHRLHAEPAPERRAHQQEHAADQNADRAPEQEPARQDGLEIPQHVRTGGSVYQVRNSSPQPDIFVGAMAGAAGTGSGAGAGTGVQ